MAAGITKLGGAFEWLKGVDRKLVATDPEGLNFLFIINPGYVTVQFEMTSLSIGLNKESPL